MKLETIDRKIGELIKLRTQITEQPPHIDLLIMHVSAVCDVPVSAIKSKERTRTVSDARCMVIYHLLKMGYTRYSVAKKLDLDYVAVLYHVKKYTQQFKADFEFRQLALKLNDQWTRHTSTL